MAEWKGVLLPGGRLELMVKPGGATPTTLVSPVIDHIIAKAFKFLKDFQVILLILAWLM